MESLKKHFSDKGWFVVDLPNPTPIFATRAYLQSELINLLGKNIPLEDYHLHVEDDDFHTQLQIQMTKVFREQKCGTRILEGQLSFFTALLGLDLYGQANPYLRITRPMKPQDNIGYHRDTFYGGSPYELSVLVPFVDLPEECSLNVLSGSHIHAEDYYPTIQIENPDTAIRKGTDKHQLGFLYAPKVMHPSIEEKMEPVALKVGQALVFSLSTVHGSVLNRGGVSRWSSDMRVMSALAPVDLSARPDYYKPLSYSVVTEAAKKYMIANGKETRDHVELELCHTAS
jgi:hypothetical protein